MACWMAGGGLAHTDLNIEGVLDGDADSPEGF